MGQNRVRWAYTVVCWLGMAAVEGKTLRNGLNIFKVNTVVTSGLVYGKLADQHRAALLRKARQKVHCLRLCFYLLSSDAPSPYLSGIRTWSVWQQRSTRRSVSGSRGLALTSTWPLNPRRPGPRHHAAAPHPPLPPRKTQRLTLKLRRLPPPTHPLKLVGQLSTLNIID